MKIGRYIHSLVKQIRECADRTERIALQLKLDYARAYAKGTLSRYRDLAIEREIGKTYSEGAQIAILFNKDAHPEEYEAYQAFRAECKAKVDSEMANLAADIQSALK